MAAAASWGGRVNHNRVLSRPAVSGAVNGRWGAQGADPPSAPELLSPLDCTTGFLLWPHVTSLRGARLSDGPQMKKGHPLGAPAADPLLLADPPRRRRGGETPAKERRGDAQGSAGPGCGLTALPGWAGPLLPPHTHLFVRAPGQSPDPRGRENGGRSSPRRVTLQRLLLAPLEHLWSHQRGERGSRSGTLLRHETSAPQERPADILWRARDGALD
ncbi:hypothetical protein NDU88_002491 [Pleurodeles waltl]|uniref:Uncharacterized protein n=1 Tax=Pleurodeles waltl TaxID=8319 RepID=A0AAV7TLD9_PLEWA|nr:hypothetical protein NDU88_002491 [Pleurodeles waltl]